MPTFAAGSIEATATLDRVLFTNALTQMQKDAEAFAGQTFNVKFAAELSQASIAKVEAELDAMGDLFHNQQLELFPVVDDPAIAKVEAEVATLTAPRDIPMRVELSDASVVKLAAEVGALGAASGPVGRKGTLAGGMLGALFGTGIASGMSTALWGETGGGFISRLLSPLTFFFTMFSAGFGSLGQFAGFGPEHLLMTLVGLVGSLTAAFAGLGLVALGSLGTLMVGGGSDMLTSHVMLSNVEALIKGTKTLAQVTASVGPAAAMAESQLATAYKGMAASFDMATGPAQAEVAGIGLQLIQLANVYIPLIAAAATKNFALVSAGLQPLFSWLEGSGGTGVFASLEDTFAKNLPNAMGALDQGLELLFRTMALAASKSGGFMAWLNQIFTYANSTAGWARWSAIVDHLIADFDMWTKFGGILVTDIADLFSKDADTAKTLVDWMTKGLEELHEWINSTQGSDALRTIFVVHREEIIALLDALVPLLAAFVQLYLTISPALVTAVIAVLGPFTAFMKLMDSNPVTAYSLAILLIATRFGFLQKAISPVTSLLSSFVGNLIRIPANKLLSVLGISSVAGGGTSGLSTTASFNTAVNVFSVAVDRFAESVGLSRGAGIGALGGTAGEDAEGVTGASIGAGIAEGITATGLMVTLAPVAVGLIGVALEKALLPLKGWNQKTLTPGATVTPTELSQMTQASIQTQLGKLENELKQAKTGPATTFDESALITALHAQVAEMKKYLGKTKYGTPVAPGTSGAPPTPPGYTLFSGPAWAGYDTAVANAAASFGSTDTAAQALGKALGFNYNQLSQNSLAIGIVNSDVAKLGGTAVDAATVVAQLPPSLTNLKGGIDVAANGMANVGPATGAAMTDLQNFVNTAVQNAMKGLDNVATSANSAAGYIASLDLPAANLRGALASAYHTTTPRAAGGRIVPGQSYLVGERGAELAVFDSPGAIIPNHLLSRATPAAQGVGWGSYVSSSGSGGPDVVDAVRQLERTVSGLLQQWKLAQRTR